MKKLFFLLLAGAALCTFNACDDGNKDDGDGGGDGTTVTTETISAKWNVSGNSDYSSFEFTEEGNYIVVGKSAVRSDDDEHIYFGTYSLKDDVITMTGFGKLTVTRISSDNISFSFILGDNPDAKVISAIKQAEMASSTKTDLLCRTWELTDETIPGLEGDYLYETDEITVIFTRAGTYLVYNDDFEEIGGVGLAQWKWTDSSQTAIYYTWDWDDWSDKGIIKVHELTSSKVVFVESFVDEAEDEIGVFKPVGK